MKGFIGCKVRALREKKGITQENLAEKSELSERFIRKIESGNYNYSLESLSKIIYALDEDIYTFFKKERGFNMKKNEELIYCKTLEFFNNDIEKAKYIIENSLLLQYIKNKTNALNKSEEDISKSRISFGNLYAIYAVVDNFILAKKNGINYEKYEGMSYSNALRLMRSLKGGSKLQNHPINNRCNDEFRKFFSDKTQLIPIKRDVIKEKYWLETGLIFIPYKNENIDISELIISIIDEYSYLIFKRLLELINSIDSISSAFEQTKDSEPVIKFVKSLLKPNVDARTFELISFVVLKYYYKTKKIYISDFDNIDSIKEVIPELYKTGRTNANDGGIDYILKPIGKVFQVTEVVISSNSSKKAKSVSKAFNKYFLDIDKLNHYPITFVIKTSKSKEEIFDAIKQDAISRFHDKNIMNMYLNCFEEIITIPDLLNYLKIVIENNLIKDLLNEFSSQVQLEFNMLSGND